ncbi:MAG TPA: prepilin-type N-terminal cleavage/methylation domain-containing protein [Phycisphaerales bacterium]|nr:prepilin-type N-terminal cleavage/methylation domain-containing protein [Phycisphaerales bacterium]
MKNSKLKTKNSKLIRRAFTLVELMIVVAILGILAAVVVPEFQNHQQKAKETQAKANLKLLREAIERYTAEHNGTPPGYINGAAGPRGTWLMQLVHCTNLNGQYIYSKIPNDDYIYGPYISGFPANPFNKLITVMDIPDDMDMPGEATGENGWIYRPKTGEIRLDYPGTDSEGISLYTY